MGQRQFTYHAWGLIIASDFALPELIECKEKPDIAIRLGEVPETLDNAIISAVLFQYAPKKLLFKLDGIARYLIIAGREIVIEPVAVADKSDIRVFLLSTVFGALLQMRQTLVFQGTALMHNGKGIILNGISSAGKSTVAAALCRKGYQLLTDEICAVAFSKEGYPMIIPGFPLLKLWSDAVEELGIPTTSLQRVRNNIEKFYLKENFSLSPVPLKSIYQLNRSNIEKVKFSELKPTNKLSLLHCNLFRYNFLSDRNDKSHLKQLTASSAKHFQIDRPMTGFMLNDIITQIEESSVL